MLIEKLKQRFGAEILGAENARGEDTIFIGREHAYDTFRALRDEVGFEFNFLTDLSAVDWLERKPRYEVVYHLNSLTLGHRLRVKISVEASELWVPSVVGNWRAADWLERECFDMFGIQFRGHPDFRRILLYDSFVGHPLRKDYPFQKRQSIVPETDPIVKPLRPTK